MISALLYDAEGNDREIKVDEIDATSLGESQLLWIDGTNADFHEQNDLSFKLGMKDCLREADALQIFDDNYRFGLSGHGNGSSKISFIVGKFWLVTITDERPAFLDEFVEADRGETLKGRMTATAMASALLLRHLDQFRTEVAGIEAAIDKLDDTILRSREKRTPLRTLAVLRRRVSQLRSTTGDQRPVIHGLIAPDFLAHINERDRVSLEQVTHAFERLEDGISRSRETVIGSYDLYTSRVAQDTNQLLKALTIASVVTGIIGAVAGVFGMNFETPIPHTGLTGFLVVTVSMLLVSIALVALAVWKRWI
jgi:magnesium transporter